jgi:hypothetical protein
MTNNVFKIAKVRLNQLNTSIPSIILLLVLLVHSNGRINAEIPNCATCLSDKDANKTCIVEANKCLNLICKSTLVHEWFKNDLLIASSQSDNR